MRCPPRSSTRCRAAGCSAQQCLELRHVALLEPKPARHAYQHGVLGRVDLAICRHRHELQLQEQLYQGAAAAADAGKIIDGEPEDAAKELVRLLREEAKVL